MLGKFFHNWISIFGLQKNIDFLTEFFTHFFDRFFMSNIFVDNFLEGVYWCCNVWVRIAGDELPGSLPSRPSARRNFLRNIDCNSNNASNFLDFLNKKKRFLN